MLDIQHVFPTLQGEGPYAGCPAVFIRLGGCNLACTFCDTEFESFEPLPVQSIIEQVIAYSSSPLQGGGQVGGITGQSLSNDPLPNSIPEGRGGKRIRQLVIITGGEPLRQPIELLCKELLAQGFTVQIETNGTPWRELPPEVQVVCSPKNTGKGYFPVRQDVLARAQALKFIISATLPGYGDIADVGQGTNIPVYVQPMDEYDDAKNAANLKRAVELATSKGCRLSLQLHKLAGIE